VVHTTDLTVIRTFMAAGVVASAAAVAQVVVLAASVYWQSTC
jgi:hypothetical protein